MTQLELIEGTTRDAALSQFFTPPKLARKLVQWAGIAPAVYQGFEVPEPVRGSRPMRVLEPSAGNGAIVRELVAAGAEVTAIEIDERYHIELNDALKADAAWCGESFLDYHPHDSRMRPAFDLVCGNFPFHLDLTGAFTLHALEFAPRVCAIYPGNVFYSEQRAEFWKLVRPTRIAYMSKRAWPGATDYVALDLQRRMHPRDDTPVRVEWWLEDWT